MEEAEMTRHLERMQMQLYSLVEEKGSFVDPRVVELSQKIDRLILSIQRLRMQERIK
ncbi:hypothetical protein YDYSG_16590 [Paenibacillus tyrfis]|uniref:aspartyl-phosphate phosphatase Spo0E family protein n=1 Tax=Paenibacillus TaxID=44249 RepID=UPI0024934D56|nr:aspartyl-phosphate phosphatase Spo0E family protein [Paenibacillus tyrfis]GLI05629.1 hypothetical protein YDYSG_16590 [Paenibacillus tyrfis]GMX67094.1 hypothetical protein Elgi_63670 [Paenibacillus elgii]